MRRQGTATRWVLLGLVAGALSFLGACGGDEYSPNPASSGPVAENPRPNAASNPLDTSIESLSMDASLEYREDCSDLGYDPDCVLAFFAIRDQDGRSLRSFENPDGLAVFDLNVENFAVATFPGVAPDPLSPDGFQLGTAFRDNKVIALVIDNSGSMGSPAGATETPTRLDVAKEAAKNFVDFLDAEAGDRIALVKFSTNASTLSPLTDDFETVKAQIDSLEPDASTNFGGALAEAVAAVGVRPGKRAVVFLTDGDDTEDPVSGGPDQWFGAERSTRYQGLLKVLDNKLVVYTVGLGTGLTSTGFADLSLIAQETVGRFFGAPTANDLDAAFRTTIPQEVTAQGGLTAPYLAFPNSFHPQAGGRIDVPVRISVAFENGNGVLRDETAQVTYTVQ